MERGKMNILEKYQSCRNYLQTGDVLLCRNEHFIGRQIQKYDFEIIDGKKTNAYYTHSLRIFWYSNCLFSIDSTEDNVKPDFLSKHIQKYSNFCVLRTYKSPLEIDTAMGNTMRREEKGIKYDYKLIGKIYLYNKWSINLFKKPDIDNNKDICSENTWFYFNNLRLNCYSIDRWEKPFFTPQDFIRYVNKDEIQILFQEL